MKSLKGLKNMSSFENNKLKNLVTIKGGNGDSTEKSRTETQSSGSNCYEYNIVTDSGKSKKLEICFE